MHPPLPAQPDPLAAPRMTILTPEDQVRLSGPGLRAFFEIARKWELSVEEQMALLDLEARSTYFQWRKAAPARLNRDRLERISHVLGIYKALRILFPQEADRVGEDTGPIETRERLGGMLKFYHRRAA